jgi:hypothetical protein
VTGELLERLFPGDSELAGLMRAFDWASSDLGPPETWPDNLRVALGLCLTSRIPIVMYWGPEFTVLYNDPYISFLGSTKHPRFLGRPGRECWSEIWPTIGPMLESVYETHTATWSEDVLMFFARDLPLEEVYVRFTFGPVLSIDGSRVEGIFCPCTETTPQVVSNRRLETLRRLGIRAGEAQTVTAACEAAAEVMTDNPADIPFAAIYVADDSGAGAIRVACANLDEHHTQLPEAVPADADDPPWPLATVLKGGRAAGRRPRAPPGALKQRWGLPLTSSGVPCGLPLDVLLVPPHVLVTVAHTEVPVEPDANRHAERREDGPWKLRGDKDVHQDDDEAHDDGHAPVNPQTLAGLGHRDPALFGLVEIKRDFSHESSFPRRWFTPP